MDSLAVSHFSKICFCSRKIPSHAGSTGFMGKQTGCLNHSLHTWYLRAISIVARWINRSFSILKKILIWCCKKDRRHCALQSATIVASATLLRQGCCQQEWSQSTCTTLQRDISSRSCESQKPKQSQKHRSVLFRLVCYSSAWRFFRLTWNVGNKPFQALNVFSLEHKRQLCLFCEWEEIAESDM